jgi:hypothetical protein
MKTIILFLIGISLNLYSLKVDTNGIDTKGNKEIINRLDNIEKKLQVSEKGHFEKYGALYVAILALGGVLYGAIRQYQNTKGQAVANFRMAWLDEFRKLCSDLQVSLDNIAFKAMEGELKDKKKTFYAEDKDFIIARSAYHKLRLMVNTSKPENIAFLDHISDYMDKHIKYYNEEKDAVSRAELTELKTKYLQLSEEKLNRAWQKARNLK